MFEVGRMYRDAHGLLKITAVNSSRRQICYVRADGAVRDRVSTDGYFECCEPLSPQEAASWAHLFPEVDDELRKSVLRRGVEELAHFTRIQSVPSILKHGLLPRSMFAERGVSQEHAQDSLRLDGHLSAVSASIGFPNYRLFYKRRREDPPGTWAVLLLKASVLWTRRCAFYPTNAASNMMRKLDPSALQGVDAFLSLFLDHPTITRSSLGLSDSTPTDPQAEVLIFEPIPREQITRIIVESPSAQQRLDMPSTFPCMVSAEFFRPRPDFAHWRDMPPDDDTCMSF